MKTRLIRLTSVLILSLTLFSCAGRAAYPVAVNQFGDSELSCASLEVQMNMIEQEIRRKIPETKKMGKNVALGVAGSLLFFPALFLMDLSKPEQLELEALRQRYNHLAVLFNQKGGEPTKELIADFSTLIQPTVKK